MQHPSGFTLEEAFRERILGNSNLCLKNAFIRSAAYEGMYEGGLPARNLIEHHVSMARGGVAMTTVSYGAVSEDGRTFTEQMHIHDKSLKKLGKLAEEVHRAGAKVSIQLTHCGYFTKNRSVRAPLAPSRIFNEYGALSGVRFSKAMTRRDMDRVVKDFESASSRLKGAGFDAVEIHMGHGYLLSQFLSPATNRRRDEYGGNIECRARYPLEVFQRVAGAVGKEFPVLVKLNLDDGLRNGFSLEDCKYVATELEKEGCAAIVLSGGFTSKTPFYMMRGGIPLWGMIQNGSSFAEKLTMALFGPLIIKKYRFRENFFLEMARDVRNTVQVPLVYLGGVASREGILKILDSGFDFIAMARALIHDPLFLVKLRDRKIERTECNRCNRCVVEMDRDGVKCVL
jgi:2,4-dienoyl-CoA reductase-like NADH-dependent reductase (Old Yellow Enzyme family)